MKAIIVKDGSVLYGEKPDPIPESDQVLIRVSYCGICGSDIHSLETGLFEDGHTPGHEFSGIVVATGGEVKGLSPGDRITVDPMLNCGECDYCLEGEPQRCEVLDTLGITSDGAMAEYVAVRSTNVHRIPDNITQEEAALTEPLTVAIHAVDQSGLPDEKRKRTVLIWGGGTIGLLLLQVARLYTEKVAIVEPVAEKRELARRWTEFVYSPEDFWDIEDDLGQPHYIFEAVGKGILIQNSLDLIRKGGTIVVVGVHTEGVETDFLRIMYNEITITGTYANRRDFPRALEYMSEGKIEVKHLISNIFPLDKCKEAFEDAAKNKKSVKNIFKIG